MVQSPRPALPKFFLWLLPLSFLLQLAAIATLHQYRTRPGDDHFEFAWEMGRVGRSIALGHGFASPYEGDTGPTAWEPPLYPYLIGGVFKVFGIYTQTSACVLLTINSLFATLTTIPIFWIAHRTFGERIAIWSAYAWALNPYVWYWSIHWIWDTTFTPFVLACAFLIALQLAHTAASGSLAETESRSTGVPHVSPLLEEAGKPEAGKKMNGVPHFSLPLREVGMISTNQSLRLWFLFGAIYGIGALANPTMLAFLPFCGLWIWRRRYLSGFRSLRGVILSSIVFFAVLSPWVIRNDYAFHRFVFLRDDFGLQFRLGNGPSADGMLMAYLQPNLNKLELEKFQRMGELAYAESCKRAAFDWVRANPGRFAVISLKRFFYYWNGVPRATAGLASYDFRTSAFLATSVLALWGLVRALRQKQPGAWLFTGLILTYPTVYYFVFPHARYRHPIEPELTILIVFLICEALPRTRHISDR